jgi:hypothetical protein
MRTVWSFCLVCFFSLVFVCCSQDKTEQTKALAIINDYTLTLHDFEMQLAEELELDKDFKLTQEAKEGFLEGLIRKQLLIQEAKKMKLDTKEEFVRAIQRYWESTLIKNLIEIKSKEIEKTVYVSEEEVQRHYNELLESDSIPPLQDFKDTVQEEIRERKKTERLKTWIEDLRKKARIEIQEELL